MNLLKLFGSGSKGTSYLEALKAEALLLESQNETHWRTWILQDINEWNERHSVSHHLSAYGGMGSINDFGFEDPWIGFLSDDILGVCHCLAKLPTHEGAAVQIEPSLGHVSFDLQGWRCLNCGFQVVSDCEMDRFIARRVVREWIREALNSGKLVELVESVIQKRPVHELFNPETVSAWLKRSGINMRTGKDWFRPCSSCGSDDTAVYHWALNQEREVKFEPHADNLPLRNIPKK